MEMTLKQKDFGAIGDYVKSHLTEWLQEPVVVFGANTALFERMVRVEEELKHQRDIMVAGFQRMDERFEQVEKRFEQVDKRFDQVDKRLDQVDKRLDQVDKRLDQVDKRFEQVDKRFEQVDKRFEEFNQRFFEMSRQSHSRFTAFTKRMDRFMVWSFSSTFAAAGIIISVLRFT